MVDVSMGFGPYDMRSFVDLGAARRSRLMELLDSLYV